MSRRSVIPTALGALAIALILAGCGGDGGGGSTTVSLGEEAAVGHVEYTDTGERGASTTLGVTVLEVTQGAMSDLTEAGFEVDAEGRNSTPYYVHVRYENQGEETIARYIDVSLEDSDGNLLGNTLIFNYGDLPFEPCERITKGKLAPGESFESCTLFLVPEGVEVGNVGFLSDMGPTTEPEWVYWES